MPDMRRKLIAGNWKMYKTPQEAMQLVKALKIKLTDIRKTDVVVCPPFIDIAAVRDILKDSKITVGAQNMYLQKFGAFTGEISAPMIKDAGCEWVIIGHSERRQYFHETDESVNQKIKFAVAEGLRPIVCIGETLEQRQSGETANVITRQFTGAFKAIDATEFGKVVIAYEPVWAIGTGKNATAQEAEDVHKHIRSLIVQHYGQTLANATVILYGGSVKPENAQSLLSCPNIDGALVGGASLDAEQFIAIVRTAENLN